MQRHLGRRTAVIGLTVTTTIATLITVAPAEAHPPGSRPTALSVTTRLSGLDAPRGIAFDSRGNLYVAESGVAGAGAQGLTTTGRVSKYPRWSSTPAWSTGFESLYVTEDPSAPPDVLGPEGLSTLAGSCREHAGGAAREHGRHERRHRHDACPIMLITSESHDGVAAATGGAVRTTQAGHLFALDPRSGAATDRSDVGDQVYAWTEANKALFPGDFPDANPYAVLTLRDRDSHRVRTFVVDAGANTVNEVARDGTLRVVAYIPNETAAPLRDATPTCIAQGPDGMLYVGTLDLAANLPSGAGGRSSVYRVDPDASFPSVPTVWASGLTTVTGCTFDSRGTFWASEMFAPNGSATPGDVVRIPFRHPARQQHITAGGRLPLPNGIAEGPDGAMYVTTNAAGAPGTGAVVRIQLHGRGQH